MQNGKTALNLLSSALNVLLLTLILFVLLKAGGIAYDMGYRIFTEPAMDVEPGRDVAVRVETGMSGLKLGSLLEEKRLVDSGLLFSVQLALSSYGKKIKPGTYTLNTSQTAEEMLLTLAGEGAEEEEE